MRLALFEPDIPQNTGTLMRLCVCFGIAMDIIEPCGFVLSDKNLKRAGMDYLDHLALARHLNWESFKKATTGRRVLLSTRATDCFLDFRFQPEDVLILGRESAGVPDSVHGDCDARVRIPMMPHARSLNVALAAAVVLGEALRQTAGYP